MISISHDIRSPLTSIKAYVEGLIDGVASDDETRKKYLSVIYKKTGEIDYLVSRIFLFSKLDMEKEASNPTVFDFGEKVSQFIQENKLEYIDKHFEFPTFRMLNEQSVDDALSMSCKRFLLRMLCKSTKNKRE